MKIKHYLAIICLITLMGGCSKEDTYDLPNALLSAKANLTAQFDTLDQSMISARKYLLAVNMDTALIRQKLRAMVYESSFVTEFSLITPAGIMQVIEPSLYYSSQGSNISGQDHIIKAYQTKMPVLSKQFLAVEGFYANAFIHPVIRADTLLGGITALFYPQMILETVLQPLFEDANFELWVMEEGGNVLYDQDDEEIGRNIFTDPMYAGFPELIAAAGKIDDEESGKTSYSFYKAGTHETVTKLTYWNTFELYGTRWKLIWVKPE